MTDINNLVIIGRLTRDPDNLAYTTNGIARLNLSIAVNRSEKRGGQWTDKASFFDVTVWGKQAENIKPYLNKGKQIAIDGYIDQQRWKKDGQKYNKVCIIANSVQLLDGKDAQDTANGGNWQGNAQQTPAEDYEPAGSGDDFPEDIPF